jgi:hypothetical protein
MAEQLVTNAPPSPVRRIRGSGQDGATIPPPPQRASKFCVTGSPSALLGGGGGDFPWRQKREQVGNIERTGVIQHCTVDDIPQ